mmetsp:Transcript_54531/g.170388  ORF Transcript_54531/g.170388 Transcript_54531/m.170388 type:complete len:350 (-) Transcript_54531:165-1214(-)
MSEYCGTASYMAPEVKGRQPYTEKCDIFSLGVISYVLLTGHPPFVSSTEMGKYRPFDQPAFLSISKAAQGFVRSLLRTDAAARPSAAQALEDPWIKEGGQLHTASIDPGVLRSMQRFSNASHFRRACLNMMAWSLTSEDRAQLRAEFVKMDTNEDGRISLNELRQALESNFSINSEEATALFRNLDDGDDEICYSEFIAVAMQERVRMHEDALWATLSRFDRGNKGFVTAADLRSILDEGFENVDAEALLREVDPDHKGQVSCQAFVEYLTSWEDEPPRPQAIEEISDEGPGAWKVERASLAARLIDLQRERELAEDSRPWKSFSAGQRRQTAIDPLQRPGGRLVQSWS